MNTKDFHLSALILLALIACSKEPAKTEAPAAAAPVQQAAPAQIGSAGMGTASITGEVLFAGTPPADGKSPAAAFPECKVTDVGDRHSAYRVSNGKLGSAFIYIKDGLPAATYPAPTEPVVLDQQGCAYFPRVFGVQVGQPIKVLNSDAILHNVHSQGKQQQNFNIGMPIKGMQSTKTFTKPEVMVEIKCDVHGWMRSYAGVLTHPFFSVSDSTGAFSIQKLPAGTYTVVAWHEKLGTKEEKVTLSDGESKKITFSFSTKS